MKRYKGVLGSLYHEYTETIGLVNRSLSRLSSLMREKTLNRIDISQELSRLSAHLARLVVIIKSIEENINKIDERVLEDQPLKIKVLYLLLNTLVETIDVHQIGYFERKARRLGEDTIQEGFGYTYSNSFIRERLYKLISDLRSYISSLRASIKSKLYRYGYAEVLDAPIVLLFDFITFLTTDWPGLDDRWACATCHLVALEVAVNKACKKWGLGGNDFKTKLNAVVGKMRAMGIEIPKIEQDIVSRLYRIRNEVVHGGDIPTDEDFEYIVEVVRKFIKKLRECIS